MALELQHQYDLVVASCELQFAWWFDEYAVTTSTQELTFRVARAADAAHGELQEAALRACVSLDMDVVLPIETIDERLFCQLAYPEGARTGILSLPPAPLGTLDDFEALGRVASQIHVATDTLTVEGAQEWAPTTLAGTSSDWLERIYRDHPEDQLAMVDWRAQALAIVESGAWASPPLRFCHGELYPAAFERRAEGRLGVAALSYCGIGHRIYDIATVRWVLELHAKERAEEVFEAFVDSYTSVRPLDFDEVELRAWVALRHLWSLRLGWQLSAEQGVAGLATSGLHRRAAFETQWPLGA